MMQSISAVATITTIYLDLATPFSFVCTWVLTLGVPSSVLASHSRPLWLSKTQRISHVFSYGKRVIKPVDRFCISYGYPRRMLLSL